MKQETPDIGVSSQNEDTDEGEQTEDIAENLRREEEDKDKEHHSETSTGQKTRSGRRIRMPAWTNEYDMSR